MSEESNSLVTSDNFGGLAGDDEDAADEEFLVVSAATVEEWVDDVDGSASFTGATESVSLFEGLFDDEDDVKRVDAGVESAIFSASASSSSIAVQMLAALALAAAGDEDEGEEAAGATVVDVAGVVNDDGTGDAITGDDDSAFLISNAS